MRFRLTLVSLLTVAAVSLAYLPPDTYIPGQALVYFTEEMGIPQITDVHGVASLGIPELDRLAKEYCVYKIEKVYPHKNKPENPELVDLSRWYRIHFPLEIPVEEVISAYDGKQYIDIIERDPVYKYDYVPSDPMYSSQWHLAKVVCDSAWDVCRGSYLVNIGIVDSGVDTGHVDLWPYTFINFGEDIDGDSMITWWDWNNTDDDNNGYIDDFYGWDFIGQDNMPHDIAGDGHGTHVAGCAAAATDNLIGVAGPGFSTRLMHLRCGQGGYIQLGYLGITYAADNGADVINCSWGASGPSYQIAQAIEYAHQMGVVITASAGNEGYSGPYNHYPSRHEHVIAVGASNQQDRRASFSNYCITPFDGNVDVMAPGVQILNTYLGGGYGLLDGTSMASPITAGTCALIISLQPTLNTAEVETTLVHGCDNIDSQNPTLQPGQLGHGRINAFKSMMGLAHYLMVIDMEITDDGNNDGRPDPGETCEMRVTLMNDPRAQIAVNIGATLSTEDTAVTITSASADFGIIMNGGTASNTYQPFVFTVGQTEPHFAEFTLSFTDYLNRTSQTTFQVELGRPDYLLVDDDGGANYHNFYLVSFDSLDLFVDVWDQTESSINAVELGRYEFVLWETGNETSPLDESERNAIAGYLDSGGRLLLSSKNAGSSIGSQSFYTDYLKANFTGVAPASVRMVYGVDGAPFTSANDTLFFIGGTGAGNYQNLDAIEPVGGAGPAYGYVNTAYIAGIYYGGAYRLIYLAFPLEAVTGLAGTVRRDIALQEMMNWLLDVGVAPGSFAGYNPVEFALSSNYPNPFNPETSIDFALPRSAEVTLKVYNSAGRVAAILADGKYNAGVHTVSFSGENLASGLYFARLEADGAVLTGKMVLLK